MIKKDYLEGSTLGFLAAAEERSYNYYTDCFLFFKKKYTDEQSIVKMKLEQLYGEAFIINGVETCVTEESGPIKEYNVSPASNPEITFHSFACTYPKAFFNDYPVQRAAHRAFSYADSHRMTHEVTLLKDENIAGDFAKAIQIECQGEADSAACAEEVTDMIAYIQKDSFWQHREQYAKLLIHEKGKESVSIEIGQNNSAITYAYVKEKMKNASNEYINDKNAGNYEAEQEVTSADAIMTEPAQEYVEKSTEEQQMSGNETPEGAGRTLYEAVFEAAGDTYEATYNAKGNFYVILGEGQENVDGVQMHTTKTVVYDRESKNGKCQLFVEYMEYNYPDGSSGNTKILNFYAVDKETGEVINADKKSWDEIGSESYRAATGE